MARHQDQNQLKVIGRNKKARHDYHIEDRIEAGISLKGTEVKSLREGRVNIKDAYARVKNNELFLCNLNIPHWPGAAYFNHDPDRERKLLVHAHQIRRLFIQTRQRGYTLIVLSIYFNKENKVKVELGLARGKHKSDKREAIKERDERRRSHDEYDSKKT